MAFHGDTIDYHLILYIHNQQLMYNLLTNDINFDII